MTDTSAFSGQITVASRIVDQLSSGLYESPAACLKELINNSFDADATHVRVFIKPDADRIIIEDDGTGMSKGEFVKHFSRISESYKREESDTTPSGRKKIGKIGIGFIAANEICDTMEILSTKRGSSELLHVEIHFDRMREDPQKRRRTGGEYDKADYTGEILSESANTHYTHVVLKRLRPAAQRAFAGEHNKSATTPLTLYGKGVASVVKELRDPDLTSWSEFDEYSQNLLRVALNVPIEYHDEWMPAECRAETSEFAKQVTALHFSLSYDGAEVRKPIVLRPPAGKSAFAMPFSFRGKLLSARGYFYAQHGGVRPRDLQGLLIRIRQAAIGSYDATFMDFPPNEGPLIQSWLSAEIWAGDELEDALNIDRKTLRLADPVYVELQEAVHEKLREVIAAARDRLYKKGSEQRATQRARDAASELAEVASARLSTVDRALSREVTNAWQPRVVQGRGARRMLVRKFSVAELYDVVLEVAREVLDDRLFTKFVRRLTKRLTQE